jgi:type VI secretion system protein ImpF
MPTPLSNRELLLPSLLDRLFDDSPEQSTEPLWHEGMVLKVIKRGLCRDLQYLLNARRPLDHIPEQYAELRTSLLNFGLPDLQSLEVRDDQELSLICRRIEEVIAAFEPRLRHVHVMPRIDGQDRRPIDRRLRFVIEAELVVEPLRESIRLVSSLDSGSGDFVVEGLT